MGRAKGTGSVATQRADGLWRAFYTTASGKRKYVYAPTQRACERKRDAGVREAQAGADPVKTGLADYLDRHIERKARNLAPESVERYRRIVRYHVRPTRWGAIPVGRLRDDDIDDLYRDRLDAGMSPKSLELLHTLVHGALAKAEQRGDVLRNEASRVERPRVRKTAPTTYTQAQVDALVAAAVGTPVEAFTAVLCSTGLRIGELLALRWSDVDEARENLSIASPEKGGVPRSIPLPPQVAAALRRHRTRQLEAILRMGAWEDPALVFPNHWGEPWGQRTVRSHLERVAERAGLPHVHPRLIRHTVATNLLAAGFPVKVVQELLGHRTSRQTLDTYAHVTPGMLEQVRAAMTRASGE